MCDRVVMISEGRELSDTFSDKTDEFIYNIKTNSLDNIEKKIKKKIITADDGEPSFKVKLKEEEVPGYIKDMVHADIDIYLFEKCTEKLEDRFISMIAEDGNDENLDCK